MADMITETIPLSKSELPDNLKEAINFLVDHLSKVPGEYRDVAILTLGRDDCYDGWYNDLGISYSRPMTDLELSAREDDRGRRLRAREENERLMYVRLKAKYEA